MRPAIALWEPERGLRARRHASPRQIAPRNSVRRATRPSTAAARTTSFQRKSMTPPSPRRKTMTVNRQAAGKTFIFQVAKPLQSSQASSVENTTQNNNYTAGMEHAVQLNIVDKYRDLFCSTMPSLWEERNGMNTGFLSPTRPFTVSGAGPRKTQSATRFRKTKKMIKNRIKKKKKKSMKSGISEHITCRRAGPGQNVMRQLPSRIAVDNARNQSSQCRLSKFPLAPEHAGQRLIAHAFKPENFQSWSEKFSTVANKLHSPGNKQELAVEVGRIACPEDMLSQRRLVVRAPVDTRQKQFFRQFRFPTDKQPPHASKNRRFVWKEPTKTKSLADEERRRQHEEMAGQGGEGEEPPAFAALVSAGKEDRAVNKHRGGDGNMRPGLSTGTGWVLLTYRIDPESPQVTLRTEDDVQELIASCSKRKSTFPQIRGIHMGRNLRRRFAHILFNSQQDAERMVQQHQASLGRQMRRFADVEASLLDSLDKKTDSAFGFYVLAR